MEDATDGSVSVTTQHHDGDAVVSDSPSDHGWRRGLTGDF
jgi:hypothetical protein